MIVTLDGEPLPDSFSAGSTLQRLIDRVREAHLGDRLVVAVKVDGRQLLDQDLSDHLDRPLGGAQQVDLTSADRRQLAADALREVAAGLGEAGQEQAAIADLLHAGNAPEAVSRFGDLLQAWQTCHKTIAECSALLADDLTAANCDGRTVREHLADLADKLRELRDAFEARDMVLLADLVRYEMPDTCQSWQTILNRLATDVGSGACTGSSQPS